MAVGLLVDAAVTSARRNVWARRRQRRVGDAGALPCAPDGQHLRPARWRPMPRPARCSRPSLPTPWRISTSTLPSCAACWLAARARVIKRLPIWLTGPLVDGWRRSVSRGSHQLAPHMQAERWSDANRCFKQCNDRAPGYRDIFAVAAGRCRSAGPTNIAAWSAPTPTRNGRRSSNMPAPFCARRPAARMPSPCTIALQMLGHAPRPTALPLAAHSPLPGGDATSCSAAVAAQQ